MVKEDEKTSIINKVSVILKKINQSKTEKMEAKEANAVIWVYFKCEILLSECKNIASLLLLAKWNL